MHVVRFLGATPAIYQSSTQISRFDAPKQTGYYAPTPGDVQLRQPVVQAPTPTTATRPPATSTTPTQTPGEACAALWNALMLQAPSYIQACLADPTHRAAYNRICLLMAGNQISPSTGAAQWAAYVTKNCPPPGAPPPPPSQPPPPPVSHPVVPPPPPMEQSGPIDLPSGGPGGDSGGAPESPGEEAGYLRQVGSIVGIGLLLAVGLTYARKKGMLKLTKGRRRR